MGTNNTTKNTGQENVINNKFNTPKSDVNKFATKINFNYNISGTNNQAKNFINPLHKFTNANSSVTGGNNINVNNSMAISSGFSNQNNNITNIHKNSTGGSYMSNNNNNLGSKTTNSKQGIKDIYKFGTTGSNMRDSQNIPITISTPMTRDNIKSFTKNLQNTSSIGTNNRMNNNSNSNNNANNGFVYIAANNNANNTNTNRIQQNNNSSITNQNQINSTMNRDQNTTKGKFDNFIRCHVCPSPLTFIS